MTKENIITPFFNSQFINKNKKDFIIENYDSFTEIFLDFKEFFDETIDNYPQEHYLASYHEIDQCDAMQFKKIFQSFFFVWNIDLKEIYNNNKNYIYYLVSVDTETIFKCFEDFNNFFESTINCDKNQHHFAIVYNCEELEAIKYKKVFDSILDNNGFEMDDFIKVKNDFST